MKSYTGIEQSKKLAEILPLESADMAYEGYKDELTNETNYTISLVSYWKSSYPDINIFEEWDDTFMPCWSLTALLDALPKEIVCDKHIVYLEFHAWENSLEYVNNADYTLYVTESYDNPVDACYEMILKLHEQKLI